MAGRWNSLDQEMVDAPIINACKGRLDNSGVAREGGGLRGLNPSIDKVVHFFLLSN